MKIGELSLFYVYCLGINLIFLVCTSTYNPIITGAIIVGVLVTFNEETNIPPEHYT